MAFGNVKKDNSEQGSGNINYAKPSLYENSNALDSKKKSTAKKKKSNRKS